MSYMHAECMYTQSRMQISVLWLIISEDSVQEVFTSCKVRCVQVSGDQTGFIVVHLHQLIVAALMHVLHNYPCKQLGRIYA